MGLEFVMPFVVVGEMRRVIAELIEERERVYQLKPVRYWQTRLRDGGGLDPAWVIKKYPGNDVRASSMRDEIEAGRVSDEALTEIVRRRELWKSLRPHWDKESCLASWYENWCRRLDKAQDVKGV